MCGRFTYTFTWKQLHRLMELTDWPEVELAPRFNVAPSQAAPVIRQREDGTRTGSMLRWGLIPSWADDAAIGNRLINARGETVAEKPAFRSAFAKRRCIVPISGFYEWKKIEGEKRKQPYWIGRKDREPIALAGLWERWSKGEEPIDSFTLITTEPNALMATLHDRMPVILDPGAFARWLDPAQTDVGALQSLIRPAPDEAFEVYPVSTQVNSPANDDPELVARVEASWDRLF